MIAPEAAVKHTQTKQIRISSRLNIQNEAVAQKLKKNILQKTSEIIKTQKEKFNQYLGCIKNIKDAVNRAEGDCLKTSLELKSEISEYEKKILVFEQQNQVKVKQKHMMDLIDSLKKKYLKQWQTRIGIANQLNVQQISLLDLQDKKSTVHNIFKWIIIAIYGESQFKYYWPNFKEQLFQKDQGADFKQRLGRVNSCNAKEEQLFKTSELLEKFKTWVQTPQSAHLVGQLDKIRQIAVIYKDCYQLAQKAMALQKDLQKSKYERNDNDVELNKWKARLEALNDRLKFINKYLDAIRKLKTRTQAKVQSYRTKQSIFFSALQKSSKLDSIEDFLLCFNKDQWKN